MFAIVGAAGKVGFATALTLRAAGASVRAILRDVNKTARLIDIGCEIAIADLSDSEALAIAIGDAESVQVIIPPALGVEDTAQQMRADIESIALALEQAKPKRTLAISDYGAHIEDDIGMPTMCRIFEQRICQLPGHKLMQGLGRAVSMAVQTGFFATFHDPPDMVIPTVSAPDVGVISAELLLAAPRESRQDTQVVHVEGPHRYSANDAAAILTELTGQTIQVQVIPRSHWEQAFKGAISPALADLLIKANNAINTGGLVDVEPGAERICYGSTGLLDVFHELVAAA